METGSLTPLGKGKEQKKYTSRLSRVLPTDSLEVRCRAVVVANLERYPPEAMGILSDDAWNAVVKTRHERTAPAKGKGGLDGKGRMHPAMAEKYLAAVEKANPHLAESAAADRLVWKDCVEFKFRSGGLNRPPALAFPWPILVQRMERASSDLQKLLVMETISPREVSMMERSVHILCSSPMCVALLKASGVGKSIKKFVKGCSKHQQAAGALGMFTTRVIRKPTCIDKAGKMKTPILQLQEALQAWREIAASSGVVRMEAGYDDHLQHAEDENIAILEKARSCSSWRQLYKVLDERQTQQRTDLGSNMRKIRKTLAKSQPKVVKVAPAKRKYENILNRPFEKKKFLSTSYAASGNNRMNQLRHESAVAASWQKSSNKPKPKATFGLAVAVAAGSKEKPTESISLANGRHMKMPARAKKMAKHRR